MGNQKFLSIKVSYAHEGYGTTIVYNSLQAGSCIFFGAS
jgi:hypothetical protein